MVTVILITCCILCSRSSDTVLMIIVLLPQGVFDNPAEIMEQFVQSE